MYGLMAVDENPCHVGISTHIAEKSDTKEDLPRNLIFPHKKVHYNLTDLINLCYDQPVAGQTILQLN